MQRNDAGPSPYPSAKPRFSKRLWLPQAFTVMFVAVGAVLLNAFSPDWRLAHLPLHSGVESVGAFAAFVIAVLVLRLRRDAYLSSAYVWVASALIGMGVLDGLHAVQYQGQNFVWLHSVATLLGGFVFFCVWMSKYLTSEKWESYVPKVVFSTAVIIGTASVFFPQYIPVMVEYGQFTIWARLTNIVGGVGFFAASWFFVTRFNETDTQYVRALFSILCFLFGLSGIVFEFSVIWDGTWWFWHGLRLLAYLIAVYFYFDHVRRLQAELISAKLSLEDTVKQRTDSLSQEIETRRMGEASIRKLALAVQHSPVMIIITRSDGIIDYVNPEFTRLTGYTLQDVAGKTPRILSSPTTPHETHVEMWATIKKGEIWRGEIQDRRKDGSEFWVSVLISPILDHKEQIQSFVAVEEDVTVRRSTEEKRKEAQIAAETANKAKSEMLANMSHELRTPLNAIIGFSQVMSQKTFGPLGDDKYDQYVGYIEESGQHLLELINDVLDVSAIEAGKIVLQDDRVDLSGACHVAARLVGPKAIESGVQVVVKSPESPIFVRADERRLKQIVLNLVSNAMKFTPQGGSVTISHEIAPNGDVHLRVVDTGIGMTDDEILVALSLFGQVDSGLDRKQEGTGLGLPLTKELAELHGGGLEVESEPGKGTAVRITLPADRVLAEVA